MKRRDPIASATLAQLYIAQGHVQQAQKILSDVLRRDPFDGAALHLRARLAEHRPHAQLAVDHHDIVLRWQGADPTLHAIIACFGVHRGRSRSIVTSTTCRGPFGEYAWERPWSEGTVVGCLGRVDERGLWAVSTTRPVSWA
jgi:hypothetical protein